jgi:hypothetical protein
MMKPSALLLVLMLLPGLSACVVRPLQRVDRDDRREHECVEGRGPGGRLCGRAEREHEWHEEREREYH